MGALQENGPCFVNPDSNSTYINPDSWNNEVNMLFIDQPTQVGFSYDILTNITWNLGNGTPPEVADFSDGNVPEQNLTFLVGTSSSLNMTHTANSTAHAAHAIWHFAQTWFEEFPYYKPVDEKISLWTESYGGKYGPAFFRFWQEQNERIANGTLSGVSAFLILFVHKLERVSRTEQQSNYFTIHIGFILLSAAEVAFKLKIAINYKKLF